MADSTEGLVRWSARLVVILFFASAVAKPGWSIIDSARTSLPHRVFPSIWLAGSIFLLIHDVLAMALAHEWSHVQAMEHTSARTEALVGWRVGWGLYLNYLMSLWWIGDALWLWFGGASYRQRPHWIDLAMWLFFGFMVFNATVVFERGFSRWMGLVGFGGVAWALLLGRMRQNPKGIQ